MRTLILALCFLLAPLAAFAVQPNEMLSDPALEARARALSTGLRCLVCRNESIDESNADLAHDLRVLVRERLVAGDSDDEVIAFLVDRYGEYVLLMPRATGANLILWLAGPAMLAAGLAIAFVYVRRRRRAGEPLADRLSPDEAARLKAILDD